MNPLETYLKSLSQIHASGAAVAETSYYPPFVELLNEVGKTLDPRVHCQAHPRNQGAGIPDMGLYTADQLKATRRRKVEATGAEMIPARGVVEAKGTGASLKQVAATAQVAAYVRRYGQVLVTNYRSFLLVTRGENGSPEPGEMFELADGEKTFWKAAAHAQAAAKSQGTRFEEYLKRVLLHRAVLSDPKDVAWFLASYARDALARIEGAPEQHGLDQIRKALEQALGIQFSGDRGDHFFHSTLVQTLFYGVFSSWVLWSEQHPPTERKARFDWKTAAWTLHVPMIQSLFTQFATPANLGDLDLVEVLDWGAETLNRVDRASFFRTFERDHAVQYFYEPFLEAFDPELRKDLGVWYTPREVVQYMVARVDTALREELDIPDGLADPRVYVLDPCCGTGAYLVEVLRRIQKTLEEKGGDALIGHDLKQAAMHRVFGFELLPAPFVVSHLQLSLYLNKLGAPLDHESDARIGVFLTNALTGWAPPTGPKQHLMWPELEEERDAAAKVKRDTPILVILGNPPYNGFAGMAVEEERELSQAYRTTKKAPKPQGQGLNDLYVRFYRMAEKKIVEGTGRGIVCFISNYSWLDGLSFTGMRERYLEVFDRITIDCLNGDKYKTGKTTPDGAPDPSIFSTEQNREGIQVGTAIVLMVRKAKHEEPAAVEFRHLWGAGKRGQLADNAEGVGDVAYVALSPTVGLGALLLPSTVSSGYLNWPLLPLVLPNYFPGVQTKRDDLVIDIDKAALLERMKLYFDPSVSDAEIGVVCPRAMERNNRAFDPADTRRTLLKRGFLPEYVLPHHYRPFDVRWIYWEPETDLLGRKSPDYFPHAWRGNPALVATQHNRKEFDPPSLTTDLGALHLIERSATMFPLQLSAAALPESKGLFAEVEKEKRVFNISSTAAAVLRVNGGKPEHLFLHVLAVLHSPRYGSENVGALSHDWPRVPLPKTGKLLFASAELGKTLSLLLDPEAKAPGISVAPHRKDLATIGMLTRPDGKPLKPKADLELTAGWGHAGKGGVTMPGRGKVTERDYGKEERASLDQTEAGKGLSPALLGETTRDVWLNDRVCWSNIPERVWEYTLGGYQVIKKWLSYRELELLERPLTPDEARHVTGMARRIAAILLLGPALDANYEAVKADTYDWAGVAGADRA